MTETAVNMGKSATEVKISVKGLKKSFGDNEVLKGLDVDIKSGEVVCVIGPSGSGKSTFLRCLNRLEDITRRIRARRPVRPHEQGCRHRQGAPAHRDGVPALQPVPPT